MEDIILIGCGQHCGVVTYNVKEQGKYNIVGILDADESKTSATVLGHKVLGNYDATTLERIKNTYHTNKFFISFGAMKYRKSVFEYMRNQGWEAVNIIHPNAIVPPSVKLGQGVLIECGCLITPNPVIGDNVVVNTGSQINHDNVIGNHVFIAGGVILSGGVTIKENSLIDDGVIVALGKTVGANSVVGAGAVVVKDLPDGVVAYGNPAKIIRPNDKW
ncbi:MAG: NeuD/PglB/VioB family sugar acetyltransferase [Clostridia bacterium]|nr:NeuD/PglB/VioB family sugar acetyltransferase [Clostridia bacterium]